MRFNLASLAGQLSYRLILPLLAAYLVSFSVLASGTAQVMTDIQQLSATHMQGRLTNTQGSEAAQAYIADRFTAIGLAAFKSSYYAKFTYQRAWSDKTGTNVLAWLQGCTYPEHYIVISAHYDHLGRLGSQVFHGADDNASGVAAMLALAQQLKVNCPAYSYIFLATDAEETGLYGSKAFLQQPPVTLSKIVLNINLDMISRADRQGRLYVTGANKYPALKHKLRLLERGASIRFLTASGPSQFKGQVGHKSWLRASDHGSFHRQGINYIFIGGQTHPQYHTVEDQWHYIDTGFLQKSLQSIYATVFWLEQQSPNSLIRAQ
jgi:Zn-dependent M28 family amino/carboxypeptidase